jgi:peptide deformylase
MEILKIVEPSSIPKGKDCNLESPLVLYKLALLLENLCEKSEGLGISAVQVGLPLNFFIVKFSKGYRYFVNCSYKPVNEKKEIYVEGCLSLKNNKGEFRTFEVSRYENISIKGKELISEPSLSFVDVEFSPTDFKKVIFQHEIGHQNGVLISDIGKEIFVYPK